MVTSDFLADVKKPRDIGYSPRNSKYFQKEDKSQNDSWITNKNSTFYGKTLMDLFVFAASLARYKDVKNEDAKIIQRNIPLSALSSDHEWALLSMGISDAGSISCLGDQSPLYRDIEKYADEGIEIIKSWTNGSGQLDIKELSKELIEIIEENSEFLDGF